MNVLVKNWLNGTRNYTVGQVLSKQFIYDDNINKQLAAGKSAYTEKLLLDTLTKLLKDDQKPKEEPVITIHEVMEDSTDNVLQAFKNEWMPIFTQMNYKRHELDKYLDDESAEAEQKRGILAREVLTLEKQCIGIWKQRDYYVKNKALPGKSIDKEPVIDPFKAAKRIETLKIYVRRYKNPADPKAAALLNQYTEELTQLQKVHGK